MTIEATRVKLMAEVPVKIFALCSTLVAPAVALAGSLPVILTQPQNLANSGTFSVVATNADNFQWRYNGLDIPGATNSSLVRSASDPTGYYMVLARNDAGWVPSQLAYLSRGSGGYVPFSNYGNAATFAQACFDFEINMGQMAGQPLTFGLAQVVAGPEIDQMAPVGDIWDFSWYATEPGWPGYFDDYDRLVPTVSPGQTVYYQVNLTYTYPPGGRTYVQPSSTLSLVAGGGSYPTPSAAALKFITWLEWPVPAWFAQGSTPTNLVVVAGETVTFVNDYGSCPDYGRPVAQWRKDGMALPGVTNVLDTGMYCGSSLISMSITNVQASDSGIYDVVVRGSRFICEPKITLSVQVSGGAGFLQSPRLSGSNFHCDLAGAAGRRYEIQWSTDLIAWNVDQTVSNATGVVSFSSGVVPDAPRFYRSRLLP